MSLLTWSRVNDGMMRYSFESDGIKRPGYWVLKIITGPVSDRVTTYYACFDSADGLLHIGSGDTFQEAKTLVMRAWNEAALHMEN